jgi:hypothetical protein
VNSKDLSAIFEQINNLKKPDSDSSEKIIDKSNNVLCEVTNSVLKEIQRVLDENDLSQTVQIENTGLGHRIQSILAKFLELIM